MFSNRIISTPFVRRTKALIKRKYVFIFILILLNCYKLVSISNGKFTIRDLLEKSENENEAKKKI